MLYHDYTKTMLYDVYMHNKKLHVRFDLKLILGIMNIIITGLFLDFIPSVPGGFGEVIWISCLFFCNIFL